ncbi:hypothetical protein LSH36_630g01064 [Paralvinella palmiformis]|uniref:Uncharacterized protein n=1 Tax=Paralvinella palmiformis TaxID=53620 RepID=A0AAD9J4R9_9ANNE|nr:hypothetical protein LSH36_630g01064 [Paralvinella palmiformis]
MFQEWKYFWLTVRHNGRCRWQPGGNFAFTCALDMNYYPFDEQSCTMEIETWFYTADKVHLKKSLSEFGLETYLQHGEWTVIGTEVSQTDRVYGYYKNEAFPEVYFTIHLRRKYTFYFMYIFLPCIMLSFVLLMVFVLPAESGEKISLGVSIMVAFSLFLLIVAEQVPDTSDAVPIVGSYLPDVLHDGHSSVIDDVNFGAKVTPSRAGEAAQQMAAIIHVRRDSANALSEQRHQSLRSVSSPGETSAPFRRPVSRKSSCTLRQSEEDHGDVDPDSEVNRTLEEWRKISTILDRLFFWMFLLVIFLPLVSLIGFVRVFALHASD